MYVLLVMFDNMFIWTSGAIVCLDVKWLAERCV